jgi:hypothetical protein
LPALGPWVKASPLNASLLKILNDKLNNSPNTHGTQQAILEVFAIGFLIQGLASKQQGGMIAQTQAILGQLRQNEHVRVFWVLVCILSTQDFFFKKWRIKNSLHPFIFQN